MFTVKTPRTNNAIMLLLGLSLVAGCTNQAQEVASVAVTKPLEQVVAKDREQTNEIAPDNVTDRTVEAPIISETARLTDEIDEALEAYDKAQADLLKGDQSTDEIGAIIWDIEQADNQTALDDNATEVVTFESLIPEGRDPSLEEEALDAAFAMLRAPKEEVLITPDAPFIYPEKQEGKKRIGIFVPLSGDRAIYGAQVIEGIEMALFQINDDAAELLYFDTSDATLMPMIVTQAIDAKIDIAIGPLFSTTATSAYPYFAEADIPVLSLSNNAAIARAGLWVLGLLPEQQIDALIAETVLKGHDHIAILADQSDYGSAIRRHVTSRLAAFGIEPASVMVVDGTVGADDSALQASLKNFSQYKPLEEDELIQDIPAPFDSVILAGGADFVLKVAPLLSYYDLGPDRVAYLGTDLWASAGLLGEPSLQGSYIATIDPGLRIAFGKRYGALYHPEKKSTGGASFLSQLGFDAMAIAASATQLDEWQADNQMPLQSPIISRLVSESGFTGYTGAFRLLADGRNNRSYGLFQVVDGTLVPAAMTPKVSAEYN